MKICIYSISPYAYCANNPINAIDLNGDSIWYTIDKDVVTMHLTGKIIDSSSDGINVNRAASDIASGISDVFSEYLNLKDKLILCKQMSSWMQLAQWMMLWIQIIYLFSVMLMDRVQEEQLT